MELSKVQARSRDSQCASVVRNLPAGPEIGMLDGGGALTQENVKEALRKVTEALITVTEAQI